MHCLEVIKARNERAAAREEAHARNDGDLARGQAIASADDRFSDNYERAYIRARQEG